MISSLGDDCSLFDTKIFFSQEYNDYIKACIVKCLALDPGEFVRLPYNEDLFAIAQKNQLASRDACLFESHRKYIDIHLILDGTEEVDLIKLEKCPLPEESNEEHDYYLYKNVNGKLCTVSVLPEGSVCVMGYDDVHRTNINPGQEPSEVTKLVVKISKELFDKEYCYEK